MKKCNEKMEVYSRIVGYFRPVQNWNPGKKQEFGERKMYDPTNLVGSQGFYITGEIKTGI